MAKKKTKKTTNEPASLYFLKIIGYFALGTLWIRLDRSGQRFALPVGLPIGLLVNTHEKLQIDRKIEMAILVIATFLSFFLPLGIVVSV